MDDSSGSGMGARRTQAASRRGTAALVVAVFAVVLWGGYSHRWSWTGINGATATLWDWLLLPLLLPTVVVPLLMPVATSRVDFVRPPRAPAVAAADDAQNADDGQDAPPPPTVPEEDVSLGPESRRSASG